MWKVAVTPNQRVTLRYNLIVERKALFCFIIIIILRMAGIKNMQMLNNSTGYETNITTTQLVGPLSQRKVFGHGQIWSL